MLEELSKEDAGSEQSMSLLGSPEGSLARYVYKCSLPRDESPMPYLHPLRTPSRAVVTGHRPNDHPWHKGLALTFAHVGGTNYWGGRTFVAGQGYRELSDHGEVLHTAFAVVELSAARSRVVERLTWARHDGEIQLEERRVLASLWRSRDAGWSLQFESELRAVGDRPVIIGSPATHGRDGAGYGGLFWRAPPGARCLRTLAAGLARGGPLNGAVSPWAAVTARSANGGGSWTVAMARLGDAGLETVPWFCRQDEYLGLCAAPCFSSEIRLEPGGVLPFGFRVLVADGSPSSDSIAWLLHAEL